MSESSPPLEAPKRFEELAATADPQDFNQLPAELRPLMMRLVGKVALKITEEYSGPLPPPEQLGRYNQILPGAAERIMAMAERQSAHRIELEKLAVIQQLHESGEGQKRAFILALVFGLLAAIVTLMGHDTIGGILGGGTVLGLVSTFIIGKREQDRSLQEKNPESPPQLQDQKP